MIERIEEALGKLLSDPSAAVREAASGAMDRTLAKRSVEEFRSRILGGTVEEKLRAIYAAAELGGSEGVSLLQQALFGPGRGDPRCGGAGIVPVPLAGRDQVPVGDAPAGAGGGARQPP